jgi:hypothetical protein
MPPMLTSWTPEGGGLQDVVRPVLRLSDSGSSACMHVEQYMGFRISTSCVVELVYHRGLDLC